MSNMIDEIQFIEGELPADYNADRVGLPAFEFAAMPATDEETLAKVNAMQDIIAQLPQASIATEHLFHAGMYVRTVRVPAGILFTSALIKRATIVILRGSVDVLNVGRFDGYNVVPASAGRKLVFLTRSPVEISMIFARGNHTMPIDATVAVAEAEAEFTDEADLLLSRRQCNNDTIVITGE